MDNVTGTGIDKLKMNMISTQIRHLRNYVTTDENLYDTLQDAADTIEALSKLQAANMGRQAADQGTWIPCIERMPKSNDYILLSFLNIEIPLIGRYEQDGNGEGAFYIGTSDETAVEQDMFVTAWMPLPDPYCENE